MTELTVLSDPSGVFVPGDRYAAADVAAWLREGELPDGLQLERGGKLCEVQDGKLMTLVPGRYSAPTYQRPHTDMRWRVLRLIYERAKRGERPPTYREMQAALGVASCGAIAWHLNLLERDGYVMRDHGAWRGVWLTESGVKKAEEVME